jgi:Na+-transporting methylmalonyl-CoA/oxaloacetate decarboxylase gamma subunit
MSGLQETFYILGIIFMVIMLLLIAGLVIGVFIIKSKINKIHDNIEKKVNTVTSIAEKGGELAALASGKVVKKAKKAIGKK